MAMLFLTGLLHAIVILGLTFASPRPHHDNSPQLDVMLVTNDVAEAQANEHAAYLAQRTQLGSGNTDQAVATGSPASRGTPDTPPEVSQEPRTSEVLTSSAPADDTRGVGRDTPQDPVAAEVMPQFTGDTAGDPRSGRGDAIELMLRGKSHSERWITPDTRASELAPYLASWKRKVERVGTINFPSAARTAKLSGSPVVEVEIAASGHLRQVKVRRSSGQGALDEAALTILRLASPFDPFPPALAAGYARLRFAYQWDFVAGALQSGAVTASSDTSGGP